MSGSYLEKRNNFEFFGEPNRANPEKLELNNPELVINYGIGWEKGPLGIRLDSTWWDRQLYRVVEFESQRDTVDPLAPAVWSHSISARYELNDSTTILAGIDNLADEKPFRTEYSIPVSAVGRSMFVRASMRF